VGIPTRKLLAIDRFSPSTVVLGEVTSLQHELRDDTVETRALVAIAVLACAKLSEVPRSLGDDVVIKLEYDSTRVGAAYGDIKLRIKILKVERK
jgi:hypothetical protein